MNNELVTVKPVRYSPVNLPSGIEIVRGTDGKAYAILPTQGNPQALVVGASQLNNIVRAECISRTGKCKDSDLQAFNDQINGYAAALPEAVPVWSRIAPLEGGGVVIDLGDTANTHIEVAAGEVRVVTTGSQTLFARSAMSRAMKRPSETGDLKRLRKYLNMSEEQQTMLVGWLSFTMAHAKKDGSKFVHLLICGPQGSGKTLLCKNIIQQLIDPSTLGVQTFPSKPEQLAIACKSTHVPLFDNMREIKPQMSDLLCSVSTRATILNRRLYTDDDATAQLIHAPLVFNSIHAMVSEPDLAQRCLPITLRPLKHEARRTDAELMAELEEDLPYIFRGLLDLTASILANYSTAQVIHPERMLEFSKWLAAMEVAEDAPAGAYQLVYKELVSEGLREAVMENPFAAAILKFADSLEGKTWKGRATELLAQLNNQRHDSVYPSRDPRWPHNDISLGRKLAPIAPLLEAQGVNIRTGNSKNRFVEISGPPMVLGRVVDDNPNF